MPWSLEKSTGGNVYWLHLQVCGGITFLESNNYEIMRRSLCYCMLDENRDVIAALLLFCVKDVSELPRQEINAQGSLGVFDVRRGVRDVDPCRTG
jgi:hypothetical protein